MEEMLDMLRVEWLNDVLCYSRSFEEHVVVLRCMVYACRPEKWELFRKEVKYISQQVSAGREGEGGPERCRVLAYSVVDHPFILHTEASRLDLGVIMIM